MSSNNWKGVMITEHNVDEYLSYLANKKGRHITQGVSFNKEDPVQMNLLRLALLRNSSFSGLVKTMLSQMFQDADVDWDVHPLSEERIKNHMYQKEYRQKKAKLHKERVASEPPPVKETANFDVVKKFNNDEPIEELKDKPTGTIEPIKKRKNTSEKNKFNSFFKTASKKKE